MIPGLLELVILYAALAWAVLCVALTLFAVAVIAVDAIRPKPRRGTLLR